jgi:hypothetical protein
MSITMVPCDDLCALPVNTYGNLFHVLDYTASTSASTDLSTWPRLLCPGTTWSPSAAPTKPPQLCAAVGFPASYSAGGEGKCDSGNGGAKGEASSSVKALAHLELLRDLQSGVSVPWFSAMVNQADTVMSDMDNVATGDVASQSVCNTIGYAHAGMMTTAGAGNGGAGPFGFHNGPTGSYSQSYTMVACDDLCALPENTYADQFHVLDYTDWTTASVDINSWPRLLCPGTTWSPTASPTPLCRQLQSHNDYKCRQDLSPVETYSAACNIVGITEAECLAHHVNSKATALTLGIGASSSCTMYYYEQNWCVIGCDSISDSQCCDGLPGATSDNGHYSYKPGQPWEMKSTTSDAPWQANSWTWETCE